MEPSLDLLMDIFSKEGSTEFIDAGFIDALVNADAGQQTGHQTNEVLTRCTPEPAPTSATVMEVVPQNCKPSSQTEQAEAVKDGEKSSCVCAPPASSPCAPYFNYKDFSALPDPSPGVPVTAPGRIPNFPAKMYAILSRPELHDIVSWMPHGRSWKVHKPREFEVKVIPTYFEHNKFSSFIRQANGWGFRRIISKGADRNSYYHEMFLRGLPHLVKLMKRPSASKKPVADANTEPDFYRISQEFPVPEMKRCGDKGDFKEEAQNILAHCNLVDRQGPNLAASRGEASKTQGWASAVPHVRQDLSNASYLRYVSHDEISGSSSGVNQVHYYKSVSPLETYSYSHSQAPQYSSLKNSPKHITNTVGYQSMHPKGNPFPVAEPVTSSTPLSSSPTEELKPERSSIYVEPLELASCSKHEECHNFIDVFEGGLKPNDDTFWLA